MVQRLFYSRKKHNHIASIIPCVDAHYDQYISILLTIFTMFLHNYDKNIYLYFTGIQYNQYKPSDYQLG